MHADDFRELVGSDDERWMEFFGVSPATYRRWKTGKSRIPTAVVKLAKLTLNGDLSALGGKDWEGFYITRDHKLHVPLFEKKFEPRQVSFMFFSTQDAWLDKRDLRQVQEENARLKVENEELKRRTRFYQRQCEIESRMGLMLARITADD